jgi:hypothetical protein
MAPEAALDDHLLPVVRLGKLEEKDARREIVDIGETKGIKGAGKLVGDDLIVSSLSKQKARSRFKVTFTSREENLCFIAGVTRNFMAWRPEMVTVPPNDSEQDTELHRRLTCLAPIGSVGSATATGRATHQVQPRQSFFLVLYTAVPPYITNTENSRGEVHCPQASLVIKRERSEAPFLLPGSAHE